MPRISKDPEERREEIISTAQQLFVGKGYTRTKVSDIVKSIGVSQGVFYYYFSSKEDVIDEIVNRYINLHLTEARIIIRNTTLSPLEKMQQMAESQHTINERENQNIHAIKGVDIHERIMKHLVTDYVPFMAEAMGSVGSKNLDLKLEVFVTAANLLFDPGIFAWTKKERNRRIDFMISFMEETLSLPADSFKFYRKLMGYRG